MIERIYKCDLCRDKEEPEALIGLKWGGRDDVLMAFSSRSTEHHICLRCLYSLQPIAAKLVKDGRLPEESRKGPVGP